ERMASRILGMGDMLTLIETAEREFDTSVAEQSAARMMEGRLTLEDFLAQLQQLKKMGPLKGIIGMMPGIPKEIKNADIDDGQLSKTEAIIHSMTPLERQKPELIDGSRRLRIANGSGSTTADVNILLKQFKEMQKMMKSMGLGATAMRRSSKSAKSKKGAKAKNRPKGPSRPMPSLSGIRELVGGPGALDALSKNLPNLGELEDLGKLRLPD
ncbi:MAG TPA: signal recognition particle protein, partial [Acidimicrobiales bacterium]|nr:signal recognition particle protein [Acidimicrobiales bacterium]